MDEERRSESIRYRKRGCVRGCPEIAFDMVIASGIIIAHYTIPLALSEKNLRFSA